MPGKLRRPPEQPDPHYGAGQWWLGRGALVAAGAAYSWWVATTTPFTVGANVAVAVGFVPVGAIAGHTLWRRAQEAVAQPARRAPEELDGRALEDMDAKDQGARRVGPGSIQAWVVVISLIIVLEVVCYVAGYSDRHAFPTLSSLYDSASATTWAKGIFAFLWVAMGWGLFRR